MCAVELGELMTVVLATMKGSTAELGKLLTSWTSDGAEARQTKSRGIAMERPLDKTNGGGKAFQVDVTDVVEDGLAGVAQTTERSTNCAGVALHAGRTEEDALLDHPSWQRIIAGDGKRNSELGS